MPSGLCVMTVKLILCLDPIIDHDHALIDFVFTSYRHNIIDYTQARRKHIFFGQARFDRHDHAYSVIQREHSINACICVRRRLRMLTLTIALHTSTQLVTPPFCHKYWSG